MIMESGLCHLTLTTSEETEATLLTGGKLWQGSGIHCMVFQGEDGECSIHEEVHPCGQDHQACPDAGIGCLHCRGVLTPA